MYTTRPKRKNLMSPYFSTETDTSGSGQSTSKKKKYPMLPYESSSVLGSAQPTTYNALHTQAKNGLQPYMDVTGGTAANGAASLAPTSPQKNTWGNIQTGGKNQFPTLYPQGTTIPTPPSGETPTTPTVPPVGETPTTPTTPTTPNFSVYQQNYKPYTFDTSSYDGARDAADSTYEKLKAEAEKTARQKKAYADTRSALMYKYLPDTMNAMGLSNTGLASQAAISMDNNYNQYVMGAMSEEANAKEDALYNYRQALAEISSQESSAKQASEAQQKQNEISLLQMAASGQYDWDYIQYVGAMYGMTEDQMNAIYNTFQTQESKTYDTLYANAFNQAATWTGTRESLIAELNAKDITAEDQQKILAEYDKAAVERETGANTDKWWSAYDVVTTTTDDRDVVEKWLKDQGFGEEDIASLLGYYDKAATERETEKTENEDNTALYNKFFADAEAYTGSRQAFENYVKSQGFTEEQVDSIMANYDKNNVKVKSENEEKEKPVKTENFRNNLKSVDNLSDYKFIVDNIEEAYANGEISGAQYNALMREANYTGLALNMVDNLLAGKFSNITVKNGDYTEVSEAMLEEAKTALSNNIISNVDYRNLENLVGAIILYATIYQSNPEAAQELEQKYPMLKMIKTYK